MTIDGNVRENMIYFHLGLNRALPQSKQRSSEDGSSSVLIVLGLLHQPGVR